MEVKIGDIQVSTEDTTADQDVAISIAMVFAKNWLEGSSLADVLTVQVDGVTYKVRCLQ